MFASFLLSSLLLFQAPSTIPRPTEPQQQARPTPAASADQKEEPPVITKHSALVGGHRLNYTVTTGFMPIKNAASGDTEAKVFFMAYTLDNPPANRPLMISFNGGPGSAS